MRWEPFRDEDADEPAPPSLHIEAPGLGLVAHGSVIALDDLTPDEVRVITGLVRAMRESVVEARNAAPAEDAYGWLSLADGTLMDARQALNYLPPDEVIAMHAAADTAWHIAHAISQMGES